MKFKATKVIKLDKFFNVGFNKKYPIISSVFAVFGIVLGVAFITLDESVKAETAEIFTEFFTVNEILSVPEIIFASFSKNMIFIFFLMFLGFSSLGFVFVYIAPFFKGLGLGSMCSLLYSSYLLKGVAYCGLLVFPAAVLQLFAIILACNESIQMSRDIQNVIRKNGNTQTKIQTNLYILRYAVIAVAVLLSAILYSLGVVVFFRLF